MKRRDFLKTSSVLSSAASLQGCSNATIFTPFRTPLEGSRRGRRVAILGGGVGGMSAAHELVERDFEVTVFESNSIPGGKARSIEMPSSGIDGRKNLPGEHGFRFFPGFYANLPDTMSRIPFGDNPQGVFDNLHATSRLHGSYANSEVDDLFMPIGTRSGWPGKGKFKITYDEFVQGLRDVFHVFDVLSGKEVEYAILKITQFLLSSESRRLDEYEKQSWQDYMMYDRLPPELRKLINAMTKMIVAAKGEVADTRTIGGVVIQLIVGPLLLGLPLDRCLNGPTNDVWINPWLDHIEGQGGIYQLNSKIAAIHMHNGEISGINVDREGIQATFTDEFDFYICALPVEIFRPLVAPEMKSAAPELEGLDRLQTNWMTGAQFYLNEDLRIVHGHSIYIDSPWSLTSISQAQFWPDFDLRDYGNGNVAGILSVDISDWDNKGIVFNKTAKECTKEEIRIEVWEQLKAHLNDREGFTLRDDMLEEWFLDPAIHFDQHGIVESNDEQLFINTVDSWKDRPDAITSIPNLFLASDYVRCPTGLATMEAANEAARLAVNGILSLSDSTAEPVKLFNLQEPGFTVIPKFVDEFRHGTLNQPHPLEGAANRILDTLSE